MKKLPSNALNYIETNFNESVITEVKEARDSFGDLLHLVTLNSDNVIYHLEFNREGVLVNTRTEPRYEDDYFEGEFYGQDSDEV